MGMAIALIVISIFSFISLHLNPLNYLFAIYYLFFGLILFMSFFKFEWIKVNFLFLQTDLGKGLFDLFLASMLLVDLDNAWNIVLGSIFGVVGIATVCFSTCCKPAGEDKQAEEIKAQAAENANKRDGNAPAP
eukprot:CAMPEP_0176378662 /NCGR_PEP_ID=MMETSP0126-20121128/29787_1 /TAXON_ID=141414 ORGANISM="Strombidinopsis acuminatum, Strain SPMC142" /NCGR_SAMPLE_ID=MMETSP0126 /ASSEMBLY_ACC=CAM_ASM_000229 /LENGTH=132 /DNA_ID=CAMNT_0017741073 /DNA_START=75 /DNA_END=473 /DNA_ORIENTATION=+